MRAGYNIARSRREWPAGPCVQASPQQAGVARAPHLVESGMRTSNLVGLTGGIACGKSTVSSMLAERGAIIVDADRVSRAAVEPDSPGLAAVIEAFGRRFLTSEGQLDRAALGQLVFSDSQARARLNGILHPRMAVMTAERIAAALAAKPPLIVYDAALLIEMGQAERFRPLVVVHVSEAVQLARLRARDGLTEVDAQARIAAQMPMAKKIEVADHLIDNGGTRAQTDAQVAELFARLTEPGELS